jgi:DNA polymerase III psi subunit
VTNHKIRYLGLDPNMQAKCACTKVSPIGSRGDCQEWGYRHQQEIEKTRARLARTPSLKAQQDWFTIQADNPDNPAPDRALWHQLADELEAFVARTAGPSLNQDRLF